MGYKRSNNATIILRVDKRSFRASTMETSIFGYLNESHTYISLIYDFLIVVSNKHSIPPTQISCKVLKWDLLINYE